MQRGVLCFLFFFLYTLVAHASEVAWIPKGRRFPLTFADPREIRMAMLFDGSDRLRATVGNYFNLVGLDMADKTEDGSEQKEGKDEMLFMGIEGSGNFSLRQGPGGTFPLETMDGLFGLYFEMNRANWQYQIRLTHISAHLGDGVPGALPIKYSRESMIARVGYSPEKGAHLYGGFSNLVHTQPDLPVWGMQLGASYFFPWSLGRLMPFTAADIQWRDEAAAAKWSINFHLGIALNDPAEPYHSFRFFYNYFSGADPRGQYLNAPFTAHSLGVEMQI